MEEGKFVAANSGKTDQMEAKGVLQELEGNSFLISSS